MHFEVRVLVGIEIAHAQNKNRLNGYKYMETTRGMRKSGFLGTALIVGTLIVCTIALCVRKGGSPNAAQQQTVYDRVEGLVEGWKGLGTQPNKPPYVMTVWKGSAGLGPGVRESLRSVYNAAYRGTRVQPKAEFPNWERIDEWLNDMEAVIAEFGRPAAEVANLTPARISQFWSSALDLADFVQNIQKGSPRFWEYFMPIG